MVFQNSQTDGIPCADIHPSTNTYLQNLIREMLVGGQPKLKIWSSSSLFWLSSFCYLIIYICGISSHTAVFVGKRKIA